MKKLILTILLSTLCSTVWASMFYVRNDGGSAVQCDGTHDAAQSGAVDSGDAGTVPDCAFRSPATALKYGAVILQGGDTLIIDNVDRAVGSGQAKYKLMYGGDDVGGSIHGACTSTSQSNCFMAAIPDGTLGNPTKIYGKNYATCDDTSASSKAELWGGGRQWMVVNAEGSDYIDVRCLAITDHDQCAEMAPYAGAVKWQCDTDCSDGTCTGSRYGLSWTNATSGYFENLDIYGTSHEGMVIINTSNADIMGSRLISNAYDGIFASGALSGNNFIEDSKIYYSGCTMKYPLVAADIEDTTNLYYCNSQSQCGGMGDGFGYSEGTSGGNWTLTNVDISHNVQDGLDFIHRGGTNFTIKRSRFEGNAGNAIKIPGGVEHVENSKFIGNCMWFANKSFTSQWDCVGGYAGFDHCRASSGVIEVNTNPGSTTELLNNTIMCWSDICINNSINYSIGDLMEFENNVFYANDYWVSGTQNSGYYNCCPYGLGCGCLAGLPTSNYNVVHDTRVAGYGPVGTGNVTGDPLFNEDPIVEAYYYGNEFDVTLQSTSSSAYNLADESANLLEDVDFAGTNRGAAWDAGAYEVDTASQTCSTSCELCANEAECELSGASDCGGTGFCCWQPIAGVCAPTAELTCNDDCSLCANQTACEASTKPCYYWSTNVCEETAEPDTCAADDCTLCQNQPDCEASTVPCDWSEENFLEDFSGYTEVDANGNVGISTYTATVSNLQSGTYSYVRDDKGDNHFGDFIHNVSATITATNSSQVAGVWALNSGGNTIDEMNNLGLGGYTLSYGAVPTDHCAGVNAQACFKFDEGSGTTVTDSSQNSNTGNFKGSGEPAWNTTDVNFAVSGVAPNSADFDGTDDYINAGSDSSIDDFGAKTITAWIYVDDLTTERAIISKLIYDPPVYANTQGWSLSVTTTGRLSFWSIPTPAGGNNVWVTAEGTITTGAWFHVAVIYDRTYAPGTRDPYLYVNGTPVDVTLSENSGNASAGDAGASLMIGQRGTNGYGLDDCNFDGKITDVGYFDRLLTPSEVKEIYWFGLDGVGQESPGWYLEYFGNTYDFDVYQESGLPLTRYFTLSRASDAVTAQIYSDSARTNLVDTLAVTGDTTLHQYIYSVINRGVDGGTDTTSFSTQNLNLLETDTCVIESAATCDTDCTICTTQQGCEGSTAATACDGHCCWRSDDACYTTAEVVAPSGTQSITITGQNLQISFP